MARKRTKKKKHSCAMCKPHKMCGGLRWTAKAEQDLKLSEKEKQDHERVEYRSQYDLEV